MLILAENTYFTFLFFLQYFQYFFKTIIIKIIINLTIYNYIIIIETLGLFLLFFKQRF